MKIRDLAIPALAASALLAWAAARQAVLSGSWPRPPSVASPPPPVPVTPTEAEAYRVAVVTLTREASPVPGNRERLLDRVAGRAPGGLPETLSDPSLDAGRWLLHALIASAPRRSAGALFPPAGLDSNAIQADASFRKAFQLREALSDVPTSQLGPFVETPACYPSGLRDRARDTLSYLFAAFLAGLPCSIPPTRRSLSVDVRDLLTKPREASVALDPTRHPIERASAVLDDLESWHRSEGREESALEARLERTRLLREGSPAIRTELKIDLLRRLPAFRPLHWYSMGLAEAALLCEPTEIEDVLQARELADEGLRAHPGSLGAERCEGIVRVIAASLADPDVGVRLAGDEGSRVLLVRHRLPATLHVRVIQALTPPRRPHGIAREIPVGLRTDPDEGRLLAERVFTLPLAGSRPAPGRVPRVDRRKPGLAVPYGEAELPLGALPGGSSVWVRLSPGGRPVVLASGPDARAAQRPLEPAPAVEDEYRRTGPPRREATLFLGRTVVSPGETVPALLRLTAWSPRELPVSASGVQLTLDLLDPRGRAQWSRQLVSDEHGIVWLGEGSPCGPLAVPRPLTGDAALETTTLSFRIRAADDGPVEWVGGTIPALRVVSRNALGRPRLEVAPSPPSGSRGTPRFEGRLIAAGLGAPDEELSWMVSRPFPWVAPGTTACPERSFCTARDRSEPQTLAAGSTRTGPDGRFSIEVPAGSWLAGDVLLVRTSGRGPFARAACSLDAAPPNELERIQVESPTVVEGGFDVTVRPGPIEGRTRIGSRLHVHALSATGERREVLAVDFHPEEDRSSRARVPALQPGWYLLEPELTGRRGLAWRPLLAAGRDLEVGGLTLAVVDRVRDIADGSLERVFVGSRPGATAIRVVADLPDGRLLERRLSAGRGHFLSLPAGTVLQATSILDGRRTDTRLFVGRRRSRLRVTPAPEPGDRDAGPHLDFLVRRQDGRTAAGMRVAAVLSPRRSSGPTARGTAPPAPRGWFWLPETKAPPRLAPVQTSGSGSGELTSEDFQKVFPPEAERWREARWPDLEGERVPVQRLPAPPRPWECAPYPIPPPPPERPELAPSWRWAENRNSRLSEDAWFSDPSDRSVLWSSGDSTGPPAPWSFRADLMTDAQGRVRIPVPTPGAAILDVLAFGTEGEVGYLRQEVRGGAERQSSGVERSRRAAPQSFGRE